MQPSLTVIFSLSLSLSLSLSPDQSHEATMYRELKKDCESIDQDFDTITKISALVPKLNRDFSVREERKKGERNGEINYIYINYNLRIIYIDIHYNTSSTL